jgi:hypothetical protein
MKPITNRIKRVDSKNCNFSEIEAGNKSRKVANRREARKEIQNLIEEDESIAQENNDFFESDEYYEGLENNHMNEELDRRYSPVHYLPQEEEGEEEGEDYYYNEPCPCCGN